MATEDLNATLPVEGKARPDWLSDSVLIAAASALIYYAGYSYEAAAAKELGIPIVFVQVSTEALVRTFEIIFILFLIQFSIIFAVSKLFAKSSGVFGHIPTAVRFYLLLAPLAITLNLNLTQYLLLFPAALLGVLILVALAGVLIFVTDEIQKLFSIGDHRKKSAISRVLQGIEGYQIATNLTERLRLDGVGYFFVQLALVSIMLSPVLGKGDARAQLNSFYSQTKNGRVRVLKKYGDFAFVKSVSEEDVKSNTVAFRAVDEKQRGLMIIPATELGLISEKR